MGSLVFTDIETREYWSYDSEQEEDVLIKEECVVNNYYYYCDNCGSFDLSQHLRPRIFLIAAIIFVPAGLFLTIFELWFCVGLAFTAAAAAFIFDLLMKRAEYFRCENCKTKWPALPFPKNNSRGYQQKDIPESKTPDFATRNCQQI